ncbi:MAG TPA: M1 family metallopeptidase, partial [Candidatus Cloacimonadota bacterium]|nr:M1 family metallopeptidase [Candidatus Cloacimonadota bacterium]
MKKSILIFVSIFICIHLFAHPKFIQPIDQNYIPRPTERADSLHGFDVQKYTLTLTINDAAHTIQGNVLANVTATDNINYIEYNLIGLNVNQVKVNDTISSFTYSNGLIHIPLNGITNGSQFTTQVDYSGIPALSGAPYNIGLIFSSTMVFTLSDPDASRYWWPCYDHPWDKAVVDLNVTMRSDWLVACNGIRTSMVDNGDGTKTHHWVGSNPMLPYLVCITASNYREINQTFGNIPIQNFVSNSLYNNAVTDFSDLPNMMSVYSQKYGPYPFEKYGNAVVNMQTFGAMEHQTMTTMGSDYIHGNHNGQWTIAHELSHQWFGNCVSPLTFKDVWLSEGFATYSEAVWEESQRGFTSMCNYIQSSFHNYYLSWEPASSPQTIYDPAFSAYFNPPSYEKAASVLHMLRLQVGDSTFWNIMQSWFQAHHNGNATTQEFEALCESISGQDLHQFFHQWIYGAGIPEIKFSYFYKTDLTNHEFHLKVFAKTSCASGEDFYVKLPIQVIHPNHSDSLLVDATPEISAPIDHVIPFTANDSIILNEDPHHWLLQRGLSPVYTAQPHALAANSSVYLSWVPYWSDVPITSYLIYRTDESTIPL